MMKAIYQRIFTGAALAIRNGTEPDAIFASIVDQAVTDCMEDGPAWDRPEDRERERCQLPNGQVPPEPEMHPWFAQCVEGWTIRATPCHRSVIAEAVRDTGEVLLLEPNPDFPSDVHWKGLTDHWPELSAEILQVRLTCPQDRMRSFFFFVELLARFEEELQVMQIASLLEPEAAVESNSHPTDEPEAPKREKPVRPNPETVARLAEDLQKASSNSKPKQKPAPIPLITKDTRPWNYGFTVSEAMHTIRDAVAGAPVGVSAHENGISEKIDIQIRQTFAHKIGILRKLQGTEKEEGFELLGRHFEARARL